MSRENPSGRPDRKRGPERSVMRQAAEAAGISRHQMYDYLAIAEIPEADFEALVEAPQPPTTEGLVRHSRQLAKRRVRHARLAALLGRLQPRRRHVDGALQRRRHDD